jgi:NitT/TauT family transport system substrate-binding protein
MATLNDFARVWVLAACVQLLLITGAAEGQSAARIKALYTSPTIQFLPAFFARDRGYFQHEGIDADLISTRGAVEGVQALMAREAEFIMTIGPAMPAFWKGQDFKILSQQMGRLSFSFMTQPEINTVQELKGKKLGTSFGDMTEVLTRLLLTKYGLDPQKDVQYIGIRASGPKVAALKQKIIDGTVVASPADLEALRGGAKRLLFLGTELPKVAFIGWISTARYIRENPAIVKGTVRALTRAVIDVKKHPEDAIAVAMKRLKLSREDATAVYDLNREAFDPIPTVEGVKLAASWQAQALKIEPTRPIEEYLDTRFLHEIIDELKNKAQR